MQNLTDRGVRYTPGDRGGASSKHKQDIKNKKNGSSNKEPFWEICYDKDAGGRLVNIDGNLLGAFFLWFGDLDPENSILEVCSNFFGIHC